MKLNCGIIGMGKLGTALAYKLSRHELLLWAIDKHSEEKEITNYLHTADIPIYNSIKKISMLPDFFLLSVQDSKIQSSSDEIAKLFGKSLKGKIIIHFSGLLTSVILNSCREQGAIVLGIHPYQTFYFYNENIFDNIFWGFETVDTNLKAKLSAEKLVNILGGSIHELSEITIQKKPVYHLSAVAASNFLSSALTLSKHLAAEAGIDEHECLPPIVKTSVENNLNNQENSIQYTLTGPIARGDSDSIYRHLLSLAGNEPLRKTYAHFTAGAAELALYHNLISEKSFKEIIEICKKYF